MAEKVNKLWRTFWPESCPDNADRPFYENEEGHLVSIETGKVLEHPKYPERNVDEGAVAAMRCGAVLVDRWDTPWGLSLGFSFPGSECAWFLLDDFEHGRFASLGVRVIEGVAFGLPVSFYWGDADSAARFALTYGIKLANQQGITSTLSRCEPFPYKDRKLRGLLGPLDALDNHDVREGLQFIQEARGVNPLTVMAATKTIEVVNE